jgi:hypothetical protein
VVDDEILVDLTATPDPQPAALRADNNASQES